MNPQTIIEDIKNGGSKALEKVYMHYRNPFILYASRHYNINEELLKEIFQDVMISFYNNIVEEKLTQLNCSIKTYLFEIGKRLIHKELRKKGIETINDDKGIFLSYAEPIVYTDNQSEMQQMIIAELHKLGERCYTLLHLFYFANRTMEHIATEMKFSNEDSAKTQKYKCFEKLKAAVLERKKG